MKTGYTVSDSMTKKPVIVTSDTLLIDCAKLMAKKHVGGLLVSDEGELQGVLTEQDIVRNGVAKDKDFKSVKVKDIMKKDIITIKPDLDIYDALVVMRDNNIRHLPVVNNGDMIGLITIKDVLKIQPQLFDIIVEKFEIREEERKIQPSLTPNEGICETCGNYSNDLSESDGSMVCPNCG